MKGSIVAKKILKIRMDNTSHCSIEPARLMR
jgi:hypothetical protein